MSDIVLSLTSFALASAVFTLAPGLDTATVLRTSTISGVRSGFGAALGITSGLLIWGLCAAFGLTALLAASTLAYTAVKWAGAIYLFTVGIRLLVTPRISAASSGNAGSTRMTPIQGFRQGLLTNLLNPKVGIFFITFLPQFIPHDVNIVGFSMVLALVQAGMTLLWLTLLVLMTVPLGVFLSRPSVVRMFDRAAGCVFMAFGLKLAFDRKI